MEEFKIRATAIMDNINKNGDSNYADNLKLEINSFPEERLRGLVEELKLKERYGDVEINEAIL